MKYQSKKDPTIFAELESENDKFKTVLLVYTSGADVGKSISISTSTLKRWWTKVNDEQEKNSLDIDYTKVVEPYPEPKVQKYIPKPDSVIEYEEKQKRKYNADLPTQEVIVEKYGSSLSKVNKTYVVFKNGCWVERKSGYINIYANETIWEKLTNLGFISRANGMKNTALHFVFKITTMDEYESAMDILVNN